MSLPAYLEVQTGGLPEALAEADVAIASTGTVTTECAYFGVPTVALYKTSWSTWQIARRIVKGEIRGDAQLAGRTRKYSRSSSRTPRRRTTSPGRRLNCCATKAGARRSRPGWLKSSPLWVDRAQRDGRRRRSWKRSRLRRISWLGWPGQVRWTQRACAGLWDAAQVVLKEAVQELTQLSELVLAGI